MRNFNHSLLLWKMLKVFTDLFSVVTNYTMSQNINAAFFFYIIWNLLILPGFKRFYECCWEKIHGNMRLSWIYVVPRKQFANQEKLCHFIFYEKIQNMSLVNKLFNNGRVWTKKNIKNLMLATCTGNDLIEQKTCRFSRKDW